MTQNKRFIARIRFKLEIYQSKGTAFQGFFERVMLQAYSDFQKVKPQGAKGDQKNDGFIPPKGIYFQIYAPEEPYTQKSIATAIRKCAEDFNGLLKHWNKETPIKEFRFVFNDEYLGPVPDIHHAIASLQSSRPDIKIRIFLPKDLEDIFLGLPEDKIDNIIGYIPDPEGIESIDYDILTEVVKHILLNTKPLTTQENLKVPDFDEKIKFNNLSDTVATLLKSGNFQASVLYEFFQNNSGFSRQELQKQFSAFYNEAQKEFPNKLRDNRGDVIFFSILKKATPRITKSAEDAVLVLMSYFFEACDIFEEPK